MSLILYDIVVERTCGSVYDNTTCESPAEETQHGTSYDLWRCSCRGDRCNTATPLAFSFQPFLYVLLSHHLLLYF